MPASFVISEPHADPALFAMAMAMCFVSTYLAMLYVDGATRASGHDRMRLLASGGVLFGLGMWGAATSTILGQVGDAILRLDPWLLTLAAANAALMSGVGVGIAVCRRTHAARLLGGILFGIAMAGSHHAVASALRYPLVVEVSNALTGLTFPAAALFGAIGLAIAFGGRSLFRYAAGGFVLAAGTCTVFAFAMMATRMDFSAGTGGGVFADRTSFAVLLAVSLLLVPCAIGASGLIGRSLRRRQARESDRLRMLADITFEGISIHADGRIIDVNEAFAALVGRTPGECVGMSPTSFTAPEHAHMVRRSIDDVSSTPYEVEVMRPDGTRLPVEVHPRMITYHGREVRACVLRDITVRKRSEEQIRYLAHHDPLTGLPNRILFQDRLEQTLIRARQQDEHFAVMCLDLDRFKKVNALCGNATGDTLLYEVAASLSQQIGSTGTVARIGADEFGIVQPSSGRPGDAATMAEKLIGAFNKTFGPGGRDFDISLSIGVALFPSDGDDAEKLVKRAMIALRRAQDDGGGRFRFFEAAMDERLRLRQQIETDLRNAIAHGQFRLHYQAQADVLTGNVVGFEALARWHHPERGVIPPAEFIPVAEECGLIGEIGEWVLRRACADAASWPRHLRVGVNLSAKQFLSGEIASVVEEVLQSTDLAPSRLELEITESVLIDDGSKALVTLLKLKALGVRLAMDDFGTGYSSLSYLQTFPFDKIKIDRSFVSGVDQNRGSLAIIRAVIGLGAALGLNVIAEGVETEAELEVLRREKCREYQGYLLSRPVPAEELPEMLSRQLKRMAETRRHADPAAGEGHGRLKVV